MRVHGKLIAAAFVAVAAVQMVVGCSTGPASSALPSSALSTTVQVVLTDAGCVPDRSSVPAGTVTFNVTNNGGASVSEVELMQADKSLGERENLAPGLSGSFAVTLQPGSYVLACPGATTPQTLFEVTAS